MNKAEVELALEKGMRVTHHRFTGSEYIEVCPKSKNNYRDEDGNIFTKSNFWRWRTGPAWNKDWEEFKGEVKKKRVVKKVKRPWKRQ